MTKLEETELQLLSTAELAQIYETNGRRSFNKTGVDLEYAGNVRASIQVWESSPAHLPS